MVLYMSYQSRLLPNLHLETDSQIRTISGRWGQRTAYYSSHTSESSRAESQAIAIKNNLLNRTLNKSGVFGRSQCIHTFFFVDHCTPTLAYRCRRGAVTSSKPLSRHECEQSVETLHIYSDLRFRPVGVWAGSDCIEYPAGCRQQGMT